MIPLSSGTALTPSMVNVLPVPVCPYAKMVPANGQQSKILNPSVSLNRFLRGVEGSVCIEIKYHTICALILMMMEISFTIVSL